MYVPPRLILRLMGIQPMPHLQREYSGRPRGNEPDRGGSGAVSCPAFAAAPEAAPKAAVKPPLPSTKFRRL